MVIIMSNMSPVELKTYLGWLKRSKATFMLSNPATKKDSLAKVELDWYDSEISKAEGFIKVHEAKLVRDALTAEAKRFLYSQSPLPVPAMQPKGFAFLVYKVKCFGLSLWSVLKD